MEKPLVSICCLVYNHEPFLRECFEGFVMQKTTFPIEVLVHDDASTDHSVDIIREYTEKYPDIFKPIYQTENQYSKGKGFVGVQLNFERAQGKYIAMCEGDDYWTDPLKLQKQVDFLEEHEEYSICFHAVDVYNESNKEFYDDFMCNVPKTTSLLDIAKDNYIQTASVVYRNIKSVTKKTMYFIQMPAMDYTLHMLYAEKGKIYKLDDKMAVYRLGVGVWSSLYDDYVAIRYKTAIILLELMKYFSSNIEVRDILAQRIHSYLKILKHGYDLQKSNYASLINSRAFILIRILLKPYYFLKKIKYD